MFEHLDDPRGFDPDNRFRQAVARRASRMRWRHRLAASSVAATVMVGAVGAGYVYVERRDAAVDRMDLHVRPSTDSATNVLLVGSDGREGEPGRAETLLVMRFAPTGAVRLLSIPRDLLTADGGMRIGQTLMHGPQELIDEVIESTGIAIDHYLSLDLDGFRELVDDIGGVPIAVETAVRNAPTGLDLAASECTTLDGEAALALVRARHLEYLGPDGRWIRDPTGDMGRTERAQDLLEVAISRLAGVGDPLAVDRLSRTIADHAVMDDDLTLPRLVSLARRLAGAGPAGLVADPLPVEPSTGSAGVIGVQLASGADAVLALYGSPATVTAEAPAQSSAVDVPVVIGPC